MQRLNFPNAYSFEFRQVEERSEILDPLRRKFVLLTPEEWVRQNLVQYLVSDMGYPAGLTAVEKGIEVHGQFFRADVIVHDSEGKPVLLAECKEPSVSIDQKSFDQIAIYNRQVGARILLVTNGVVHYCWSWDEKTGEHRSLDSIPRYGEI